MVPLSGRRLARLDALAPDSLVAITAPAPAVASAAAPTLHWSTADDGVTDAWGATVALDGDSLAGLAPAARRTLAAVTALSDHDDAPAPRLYGGQCFDPARPHDADPAWAGAPRARLVLPTWTRTTLGGRTWLQWTGAAAAARALRWNIPDGVLPAAPPPAVRAPDPEARPRWEALVRA
ncbi:MAG: hypothetical protein JWM10_4774, partial [Myxococcaceae bacterium]|nr:hypothetical protein [Myxococcaceae bacterium]